MDPTDILSNAMEPAVCRDGVHSWPAVRKWSLHYLSKETVNSTFDFRIGIRRSEELQWERCCPRVKASIEQFSEWLDGVESSDNPFHSYSIDKYWAYADYLYVSSALKSTPGIMNDIDWSIFDTQSQNSLNAWNSTLWIGIPGAYTPCHYDTYGYNIVAQIAGSKTWLLFPPSDSRGLYPTRVPFEESTVYSRVHVLRPDSNKFPNFNSSLSPRCVTLRPGDVLYVPRHWWHSVCTEGENSKRDVSISLNMWIDQPSLDDRERFKEAITSVMWRALDDAFGSQTDDRDSKRQRTLDWSGGEEPIETFNLLVRSYEGLKKINYGDTECISPPEKRRKLVWEPVASKSMDEVIKVVKTPLKSGDSNAQPEKHTISFDECLRVCTDPRVVELMCEIFLENKTFIKD